MRRREGGVAAAANKEVRGQEAFAEELGSKYGQSEAVAEKDVDKEQPKK